MALGHRVLVPLDGSPFAERVLPLATALAEQAAGELRLLAVHVELAPHSAPPAAATMIADANRQARKSLTAYLDEISATLRRSGARAETEVRAGIPDVEIIDFAEKAGCELIAMATHGRSGFRRAWLGSVADRVVRSATIPVLLVPVRTEEDSAEERAPDLAQAVRTVIIPLDGSSFAEQILVPATALGEAFSADYLLFRSLAPPAVRGVLSAVEYAERAVRYLDHDRVEARAELERIASAMGGAGFTVGVTLSEEAEPVPSLLRLADARPDSVIAMTTHGRGGLRRALLGSVADKVIRSTNRPVLLFRPGAGEGSRGASGS